MARERSRLKSRATLSAAGLVALLVVTALLTIRREPDRGIPTLPPSVEAGSFEGLPPSDALYLPTRPGSLRFAVMGDVGRGDQAQFDTARQLTRWRERFDFNLVLLLGDNNYGTADDYGPRFEAPYRDLIGRGVTFQAVLGNHDPPGQTGYRLFNMGGHRYYTFTKAAGVFRSTKVQFFGLDTVHLDRAQLRWLRDELLKSDADWKIAFYHHPIYTSARYRVSASALRRSLEPIFIAGGLDVGFNGHEHVYERVRPQHGITYFTSGSGGALRRGDLRPSSRTASGYDSDTHFLLIEIAGDTLFYQAVNRRGETIDQGTIEQKQHARPPVVHP